VHLHFEELDKVPHDAMKNLVTSVVMTINGKGQKQYEVESFLRITGSTNEISKLAKNLGLEPGQRRFALFEAITHEKQQDHAFFSKLADLCRKPSVRKWFARYWLSLDISTFSPEQDRPQTKLLKDSEQDGVAPEAQFLVYLAGLQYWTCVDESGHTDTFKKEDVYWMVDVNAMFERYNAWCQSELGKPPVGGSKALSRDWKMKVGLVAEGGPLVDRKFRNAYKQEKRCWAFNRTLLRQWLKQNKVQVDEVEMEGQAPSSEAQVTPL
jgi:hypothetical protein